MSERNWNTEIKNLEQSEQQEFWKPEEGEYSIKFLDDGTQRQFVWEEQEITKVDFKVEIDKKEYIWSVTKGRTTTSLYGQIALIGSEYGSLVGKTITLFVKGKKMQRQYFVKEANEISRKRKVESEKVER